MKKVTPIQLANEFSSVLKTWLTAEEMKLVIEKNSTPEYNDCCASHDYCDANMAMDEAFTKLTGKETNPQSDTQRSLWNNAWTIAKENKFAKVID